jgi:Cu/Ag efflux protein CusF
METHTMDRRKLIIVMLAGLAAVPAAGRALAQARHATPIEVWKDPNCGCCDDWITYLEHNGFAVRAYDIGNVAVRHRLGMPERFGSCHTARVEGYVIEGHVPAADIRRLLRQRPDALGISVPGMPIGSPGMDGAIYGGRRDPYHVLLIGRDGSSTVWASYHQPAGPRPAAQEPVPHPEALTDSAGRPWVEAEVRRIDTERQRVSLRHGPIPNLEMAPMTMVFQVRDPALLQRLRQGERIRFSADRVDGEYTLMEIAAGR